MEAVWSLGGVSAGSACDPTAPIGTPLLPGPELWGSALCSAAAGSEGLGASHLDRLGRFDGGSVDGPGIAFGAAVEVAVGGAFGGAAGGAGPNLEARFDPDEGP